MARIWLLTATLICVGTLAQAQLVCHQRAEFITELGKKNTVKRRLPTV